MIGATLPPWRTRCVLRLSRRQERQRSSAHCCGHTPSRALRGRRSSPANLPSGPRGGPRSSSQRTLSRMPRRSSRRHRRPNREGLRGVTFVWERVPRRDVHARAPARGTAPTPSGLHRCGLAWVALEVDGIGTGPRRPGHPPPSAASGSVVVGGPASSPVPVPDCGESGKGAVQDTVPHPDVSDGRDPSTHGSQHPRGLRGQGVELEGGSVVGRRSGENEACGAGPRRDSVRGRTSAGGPGVALPSQSGATSSLAPVRIHRFGIVNRRQAGLKAIGGRPLS